MMIHYGREEAKKVYRHKYLEKCVKDLWVLIRKYEKLIKKHEKEIKDMNIVNGKI